LNPTPAKEKTKGSALDLGQINFNPRNPREQKMKIEKFEDIKSWQTAKVKWRDH
jgi:hypothetical protein